VSIFLAITEGYKFLVGCVFLYTACTLLSYDVGCVCFTPRELCSHVQVGVNVNLDATFLERDYGIEVANTVDLRTHARNCWVEVPPQSLAGMASFLLKKDLPKDPNIRLSRWSAHLSESQVTHVFLVFNSYGHSLVSLECRPPGNRR